MALTRIFYWFGGTLVICACLFALAAFVGFLALEFPQTLTMAVLSLATGILGTLFLVATAGVPARESSSEALVFLTFFWASVPMILGLPFVLTGVSPGLLAAYFEGVSAFTTTGATRLDVDALPATILFWRALVQWFGGVCVATFAVVVLAAVNQTGTGVHKSMLFTLRKGELFVRLIAIGRLVAGIYLFLAAIAFILMTFSGAPAFDALCLSLSGISTGGLTPRAGPLNLYIPPLAAAFLAMLCLMGAMNVAVLWDYLRLRKIRDALRLVLSVEHRALFAIFAVMVLLGTVFAGLSNVRDVILDAAYFVSSAGFQYQVVSIDMIPPAILITVALIGGSALSTAGGVKLIRMLLLFRHLSTELSRLSHPSRVIPVRFRSQTIPDSAFLSIWMYFFAYTLAFGVGIAAMGVVGLPLDDAIATSAASLSNVGPLLGLTLPESGLTWAAMTPGQTAVAILLMLLGRIEILAAMVLVLPNFWRN